MAEAPSFLSKKRYAVVTGANKGLGFEICRQLASNGVRVVLTARDETRGMAAAQKLKDNYGFSDLIVCHQLNVTDPKSIASLADFVNAQFGKLDILVNNAGVGSSIIDYDALRAALKNKMAEDVNWKEISEEPQDLGERCVRTNYYGAKAVTEAFLPLLQLSDSPRIMNVSSSLAQLKNTKNEWAKGVLSDGENLTEDKIEEVLNAFFRDLKSGNLEHWHPGCAAYVASKAALNAYTRVMAKKYPSISVNSVCPGFIQTDINDNAGYIPVEVGAKGVLKLALIPHGGPSGLFFSHQEVAPF